MSARTKIIIAGAVVSALIGLIVIDLATAPEGPQPPADREPAPVATTFPPEPAVRKRTPEPDPFVIPVEPVVEATAEPTPTPPPRA